MINTTLEKRIAILDNEGYVTVSVVGDLTPEQIVKIREDINVVVRYFEEKYGKIETDQNFMDWLNKQE